MTKYSVTTNGDNVSYYLTTDKHYLMILIELEPSFYALLVNKQVYAGVKTKTHDFDFVEYYLYIIIDTKQGMKCLTNTYKPNELGYSTEVCFSILDRYPKDLFFTSPDRSLIPDELFSKEFPIVVSSHCMLRDNMSLGKPHLFNKISDIKEHALKILNSNISLPTKGIVSIV